MPSTTDIDQFPTLPQAPLPSSSATHVPQEPPSTTISYHLPPRSAPHGHELVTISHVGSSDPARLEDLLDDHRNINASTQLAFRCYRYQRSRPCYLAIPMYIPRFSVRRQLHLRRSSILWLADGHTSASSRARILSLSLRWRPNPYFHDLWWISSGIPVSPRHYTSVTMHRNFTFNFTARLDANGYGEGYVERKKTIIHARTIGRYFVECHRFDPETIVTSFTIDALAAYFSVAPQPSDVVFQFGPMNLRILLRNTATSLTSPTATPTFLALVRDYIKSWSAFECLFAMRHPIGRRQYHRPTLKPLLQ
ncbi:hypothetical protein R3P38DRAFT_3175164 [Favolaschia claudopus]|uniref:Uncharacterized protein n=1 Tax=Favolaschia claudopus TaxID=2862362 RepID=A0AAW0DCQ2_9AGAR